MFFLCLMSEYVCVPCLSGCLKWTPPFPSSRTCAFASWIMTSLVEMIWLVRLLWIWRTGSCLVSVPLVDCRRLTAREYQQVTPGKQTRSQSLLFCSSKMMKDWIEMMSWRRLRGRLGRVSSQERLGTSLTATFYLKKPMFTSVKGTLYVNAM